MTSILATPGLLPKILCVVQDAANAEVFTVVMQQPQSSFPNTSFTLPCPHCGYSIPSLGENFKKVVKDWTLQHNEIIYCSKALSLSFHFKN